MRPVARRCPSTWMSQVGNLGSDSSLDRGVMMGIAQSSGRLWNTFHYTYPFICPSSACYSHMWLRQESLDGNVYVGGLGILVLCYWCFKRWSPPRGAPAEQSENVWSPLGTAQVEGWYDVWPPPGTAYRSVIECKFPAWNSPGAALIECVVATWNSLRRSVIECKVSTRNGHVEQRSNECSIPEKPPGSEVEYIVSPWTAHMEQ